MRQDMHKLLCLRPRVRSSDRDADRTFPRTKRNKLHLVYGKDEDGEYVESNAPVAYKMGRFWCGGGTKEFGEYFAPLRRWLDKQVGRPWNLVYKELRSVVNKDNAVRAHALVHVSQWVQDHVHVGEDGRLLSYRNGWELADGQLYLHPETKILLRYRRKPEPSAKPAPHFHKIDGSTILLCKEGIWYRIQYSREIEPSDFEKPHWERERIGKYPQNFFGDPDCRTLKCKLKTVNGISNPDYLGFTKKQLSGKELRHYGLKNQNTVGGM